jgi:hypothetical protein
MRFYFIVGCVYGFMFARVFGTKPSEMQREMRQLWNSDKPKLVGHIIALLVWVVIGWYLAGQPHLMGLN